MTSASPFHEITLNSDDVPGANLDTCNIEKYSNVQLKRWLDCRGLKSSGKRDDLLKRCKDAIACGKDDQIDISIDDGKWYNIKKQKIKVVTDVENKAPKILPIFGWNLFPSINIPSNFNYGHVYHYLLESVVMLNQHGNRETADLSHMTSKPLTKGRQYLKSGNVTNIMDHSQNGNYYLKAKVLASMRNEQHHVSASISSVSGAILDASCTCHASALGRCNHVASLLLMLSEHCENYGYEVKSCTSKLCQWNRGKREKKPGKVSEATYQSYKEKCKRPSDFDPRPTEYRTVSSNDVNQFLSALKCDNLNSKTTMWGTLLEYKYEDYEIDDERKVELKAQTWTLFQNLINENENYCTNIYMIQGTESQSQSCLWKANRWFRITASTAKNAFHLGCLLHNDKFQSDETLRTKLFKFISTNIWGLTTVMTPDMKEGLESEDKARNDYQEFLKSKCNTAKVIPTGLWINSLWPELGCSPDGLVHDPSDADEYGLVEIKCLKIFRKVSPSEVFDAVLQNKVTKQEISNACFSNPPCGSSKLELKTTHAYFYQIQFQLAVTDLKWCDFVLWSTKGKPNVQRIKRDDNFIKEMIQNVTSLWHNVIAPEIFEMRVPRKLNPIILQ